MRAVTPRKSPGYWLSRVSFPVLTLLGILTVMAEVGGADGPVTQPASAAQPGRLGESFSQALIIPIEDEITDITFESLKRRVERVRHEHIPLVILDLDTPGGALGATLEICNSIKQLRNEGVRVYAWVDNEAYSAGTIIALATDGIVMSHNATIGDCQPIMVTGMGATAIPEEIEAKATSPLLEELRDSALRNGYNLDMVFAFIRPEMQMFWVVNRETGEKRFVDARERNELFGWADKDSRKGLLGLFGGGSDKRPDTDPKLEPLSDSESKTSWRYVTEAPGLGPVHQPVVSSRELLTMRDNRALAYGFSKATIADEAELRAWFDVSGSMERLENTWIESTVEWLASPMVRSVLFVLMLLGAYAEFQTPGFGVAGAVALVALVLFLGAPYLAGFTVTWEIVAIVAGIVLLLIEAFVIPGFGVAGILGILLLVIGLLSSFAPPEPLPPEEWFRLPSLPMTYTYLKHGLYALAGGMVVSIFGMYVLARYLPKAPVARRIIAPNPTHAAVTVDDPYHGVARVGDIGQSESLLRPAGKARFGAMLVDVVSEGEYIESGVRIEVVERRGNRVVVRRKS